jgi:hypothetical protein
MKKRMMMFAAVMVFAALLPVTLSALDRFNKEDSFLKVRPNAELGLTKVLNHTIQFGESGTVFDYVKYGGQEILFSFTRYSIDVDLGKRNTVTFLYQPLTLETKTRIPADFDGGVTVEEVVFPAGSGLNLKYGFDFWRLSYMFNIFNSDRFLLGAGVSLQLRNASIVFENTDGTGITVNQNLGPVPILKLKAEYRLPCGFFFGGEVDGFYASSAIFNGADFEFKGWIYDAALRFGKGINPATDLFLSVRLLGGGAQGTSQYEATYWTQTSPQFTDNSLTVLVVSAGARLK